MKKNITKKLVIVFLLLSVSSIYAQKSEVRTASSAYDNNQLDIAETAINKAIDGVKDEKTINEVNTWLLRGNIYLKIYNAKGFSKEPVKELNVSAESYMKASELAEKKMAGKNKDHKKRTEITAGLNKIVEYYLKEVVYFNKNGYFKKEKDIADKIIKIAGIKKVNVDINKAKLMKATACRKLREYKKAKPLLNELIKAKYGEAKPYYELAIIENESKKETEAIKLLKNGIETYPEKCDELIIYLSDIMKIAGKNKELIKYLETLSNKEQNNAGIISALGYAYSIEGNFPKAKTLCNKAQQTSPDAYITNLYSGLLFYQKGIEIIQKTDKQNKNIKESLNKTVAIANAEFKRALPFLINANKKNVNDSFVLKKLLVIYRKLHKWNEYIETKKQLDVLIG